MILLPFLMSVAPLRARVSNASALGGHRAVTLGLEHAKTIAEFGWSINDIKNYLFMHSENLYLFFQHSPIFNHMDIEIGMQVEI